jgi:type I restriction enzyme S subunit
MAAEIWSEWPFDEVIDFQEGPGILAKDFCAAGIPLVRLAGLERGASVLQGCNYLAPEIVRKRWAHFALRKGDILLSTSASLGRIAVVDDNSAGAIAYTGIIRMRPRDRRLYAPFIRYLLEGPDFQQQAERVGVGSVIRHFGPMHLRQMTVRLPPPAEQRAITRVLGALDDKIELNQRMNKTLEAMARTLFKSWFVDFDPVRDATLRKPFSHIFADHFDASPLGKIPSGWEATNWGKLVRLEYGKGLSGYARHDKIYPVYGTNGKIGSHCEPLCPHPGIIIGRKGAYRGIHFCDVPFFVIDTAFYVEPREKVELRWAYYELLRQDINSMDSGSAIPSTSREDFYSLPVIAPPIEVQRKFVQLLEPNWTRQRANDQEVVTLTALRDTLLPKLISGELRVRDAEHVVAEAAV